MEAAAEPLWPQLSLIAAVAASHMSMPNHWLPYSLVARAHSWSLRNVLFLTSLGALGHVTATVIVCAAISGLGGALLSHSAYTALSTAVLLALSLYYLYTYAIRRDRSPCCEPSATTSTSTLPKPSTMGYSSGSSEALTVQRTAAFSLVALTTLSPCVGSMPIVLTILSPPVQVTTLASVWLTLFVAALAVMLPFVALSYLGANSLPITQVRRHERLLLGLALLLLAALNLFVFPRMHHHHHQDRHHHGQRHSHERHHGHLTHAASHRAKDTSGNISSNNEVGYVHIVHGTMQTSGENKQVNGVPYGADIEGGKP